MRDAADDSRFEPVASPLTEAEINALAARTFHGLTSAVLAVSGGADSMALLLLARAWRRAGHALPIIVATVDHRLREESTAEARWVGTQARAAEFSHRLLTWKGQKPSSGIQEAARQARYDLLAGLVGSEGLPGPAGIVVGHHRDDQAETFVMRLGRGSGLDGLAGMAAVGPLAARPDIELVRPFLDIPKGRLVATLEAHGLPWIEDPSNADPAFERVRVRRALAGLGALGIGSAEIGLTMRRLMRAREALDAQTRAILRRALDVCGGACGKIAVEVFEEAGAEFQVRLVQRLIGMYGAPGEQPRLAKVEKLADRLATRSCTATLAGCRLSRTAEHVLACREPGRSGLMQLELPPGTSTVWDGRFRVTAAPSRRGAVTVRALAAEELAALRRVRAFAGTPPRLPMPHVAALTLPSFWDGHRLLGVSHPALGEAFSGALEGLTAHFVHAV